MSVSGHITNVQLSGEMLNVRRKVWRRWPTSRNSLCLLVLDGGVLFSACISKSRISACLGVSVSGEWLGRIHKVELPRHLTRAEADTLVTSCISEGVSASVSAEYNTPKFVDNPKYVLAPMTKSHNLAVLRNIFQNILCDGIPICVS